MRNKKFLKSICENVWLFNIKEENDLLVAGFACFLHNCPVEIKMVINKIERKVMVPSRAANGPVPVRMLNARLSLLPLTGNE
jgi:hypothetical protein